MTMALAYRTLVDAAADCTGCGACTKRCEVLADAPVGTVGALAGLAARTVDGRDLSDATQAAAALEAIEAQALTVEGFAFAVRRCCMCSSCTLGCPSDIDARSVFCAFRELFALSGVTTLSGFESTQVDKEWHIFSVYRAVYGIGYSDLPHLGDARTCGADTLFFPGCTLASYAPDLARAAYASLADRGIDAVFSEECCGSPLKSGGLVDRSVTVRTRLVREALEQGIRRIVCVCPGCRDELESVPEAAQLEFVALPHLLAESGLRFNIQTVIDAVGRGASSAQSPGVQQVVDEREPRVTFLDSCHDRSGDFGRSLRTMAEGLHVAEMRHAGERAMCCGAGGAVSLVDVDLCDRRAQRVFDEAGEVAQVVITNCPTCSYSLAAYARAQGDGDVASRAACLNYLELAFGLPFNWDKTFSQLESMWSGEYGAWVCQQLL